MITLEKILFVLALIYCLGMVIWASVQAYCTFTEYNQHTLWLNMCGGCVICASAPEWLLLMILITVAIPTKEIEDTEIVEVVIVSVVMVGSMIIGGIHCFASSCKNLIIPKILVIVMLILSALLNFVIFVLLCIVSCQYLKSDHNHLPVQIPASAAP